MRGSEGRIDAPSLIGKRSGHPRTHTQCRCQRGLMRGPIRFYTSCVDTLMSSFILFHKR